MSNYSETPVEVPSPFGVWKDGVKEQSIGPDTRPTYFPGWVDPITGYTIEDSVSEQVGMQAEGDDALMEVLSLGRADLIQYLIDVVIRITGREIDEQIMLREER